MDCRGGGQNQYETIEEAIIRECLEETGYRVIPERFAGLYEEIYDSIWMRENRPDYAHKILHIFKCRLASDQQSEAFNQDESQMGCEWISINQLSNIKILPGPVGEKILELIAGDVPLYLGAQSIKE